MSFRAWLPGGWRKTGLMGNSDRSMRLQAGNLPKRVVRSRWALQRFYVAPLSIEACQFPII